MKVSGTSIERLLQDRIARNTLNDLTTTPTMDIVGYPEYIAISLVNSVCYAGALSSNDIIPYLQQSGTIGNVVPVPPGYTDGTLFGTIQNWTSQISAKISLTSLYDLVKNLGDTFSFGFRFYKIPDQSKLYFVFYSGNDRTTSQTTFTPVIFGPSFDNLQNISEYTSYKDYKNVAIVFSNNGVRTVYGIGVNTAVSGFDRRVMYVDASDITLAAGTDLNNALDQRGLEALGKQKSIFAFDGEITTDNTYKYKEDYYLGDLVEFQNTDGITNIMRVTEQIFISDAEGVRSYPTLSTQTTVTPGSWYSLNIEEWDTTTGVWDDF
jgi:hypothetical protein